MTRKSLTPHILAIIIALGLPLASALAAEITIGMGTGTWVLPLATGYRDARTQSIYLASEIGTPGQISSLALNITGVPGADMENYTIRLRHTALSSYATASWESDWTVVYQNNEPPGSTGWRTFVFTTPFTYNGTDNLMVDISYNNSATTGTGYCGYTQQALNLTVYARVQSTNGDPLAWSGTANPPPLLHNYRPNIKIVIEDLTDTDGDGLLDYWENQYSCMMADTVDNAVNYDSDGLHNEAEYAADTNPCVADTDGDGLSDGDEVLIYTTNPKVTDTDGDGMPDGWEVTQGFNPLVNDGAADADSDGLSNAGEYAAGTDPYDSDSDDDTMPDGYEVTNGLNPLLDDATGDFDSDGLTNLQEFTLGTRANLADSDGDGLSDGAEVNIYGTNPLLADTDGGSEKDGAEVARGANPLDPNDDRYEVMIGTGTGSQVIPYRTQFMLARTQAIYLATEIGTSGTITTLAVDVAAIPPVSPINLTVRMRHTELNSYNAPEWESAGWTVVYQSPTRVLDAGWQTVILTTPFVYNGADNLMVDWSFNDPSGADSGSCRYTTQSVTRTIYYQSNTGADPLTWSGASPAPMTTLNRPNLKINFGVFDTDNDGLPDSWEDLYSCMRPTEIDNAVDYEPDGLINDAEYSVGTDPCVADTDGDGLSDGDEVLTYATNPLVADTDGDGMPDGWEAGNGINPLVRDGSADADGDGLENAGEYAAGTDPQNLDSDNDAMIDGYEVTNGLDPLLDDTSGDFDGDGLPNLQEFTRGTRANLADTDGDGLSDGAEVNTYGTNPLLVDTDGGGERDGIEVVRGANPLNPNDDVVTLTIGTQTNSWGLPLATNYDDARTQQIYWASEIGRPGLILSLALNITTIPGQAMNNFTIRLKHTTLSTYAIAFWEQDWTVVYEANENISATGWHTFILAMPFSYNGTDNLMVDFSFDNASHSTAGAGRCSQYTEYLTLRYQTNSLYGDPRLWTGATNPAALRDSRRPNLRLQIAPATDTDGDRIPDFWEYLYSCMQVDAVDNALDYDADGLDNDAEYAARVNPCVADTDGDGLPDGDEFLVYATNPRAADTDGDGMPDGWEVAQGFNPLVNDGAADADGDGLGNAGEYDAGTGPYDPDTDNDTMPDGYEVQYGLNPLIDDVAADLDGDGLANLQEFNLGTKPNNPDSDGDGMPDGWEMAHSSCGLNPLVMDAAGDPDGDRVSNLNEYLAGADPCVSADLDSDNIPDDWERQSGCLDPMVGDSLLDADSDALDNLREFQVGTLPCVADSDGDALPDGWEYQYRGCGFNPLSFGSECMVGGVQNIRDNKLKKIFLARVSSQFLYYTDKDGDELREDQEYAYGTNPCLADTDGDGLDDAEEISVGADPNDPDSDHDGVNDGAEHNWYHTNPLAWDTDGDALLDGYEIAHLGSAPALDPNNALDGVANFDADANPNAHEYWNGADPWTREATGGAGCFYWGDAGAGDGVVGPSDAIEMKKVIIGIPANYSGVIPNTGETQDLSMDGSVGPSDFIVIQQMILSMPLPTLPSRPVALEVIESPGAPVLVGNTCHVTVAVRNEAGLYTPGIGVVFEMVAGPGTATLLGGDGAVTPNKRYDISNSIAFGRSRIVLRIESPGAITVKASIPACGAMALGRSCAEIVLNPAAVITGQ